MRFGSVNIGEQEEYSVTSVSGGGYDINLSVEPTQFGVSVGDLCVYGENNYVTDDFLVKSISRKSNASIKMKSFLMKLLPFQPACLQNVDCWGPHLSNRCLQNQRKAHQ